MKHLTSKIEGRDISHIKKQIKSILLIIVLLFITVTKVDTADASTVDTRTQVNVRIDYLEEIAVVTPGTGNSTKFYMSTDNKNWEVIEPYGVVDISTILQQKAVTIYFKGNKDTKQKEETLQAEDSSLKVTYKITGGVGKIEFVTTLPVEFRKGANGAWKTATNQMPTSIYEIKGATLHFRTTATATKRAGKTFSLKIAKRPTGPSVKLDGSKLCITGLKIGETQYRVGDSTKWIPFSSADPKAKTIDLYSLLGGTASNTPIPAGLVEFCTLGTDKKITSATKVMEIPIQPSVPDVISVSGSALTIKDPDTKRAYEYTKVEKNGVLNMKTAKWTMVTSKNTFVIRKVSVGDKILVRLKSKTDTTTKQIIPASTYKVFEITTISN